MNEGNERCDLAERFGREAVHTIRNYMAVAAGAVRLARDASNRCDLLRYLDSAEGAIRRCGAVADSLTKLAAAPASAGEFDLNETIRLLEPLFQALAGPRVAVELQLCSSKLRVRASRNAFEAALLELVANARDAIAARGRIRIRSVGIGRRLLVMVADDGAGMAAEIRAGAASRRISTKADGTGTGLAQVRGFAADAHGRMQVRSAGDHGTVIALNLPMVLEDAPAGERSGAHSRRERSAPSSEEMKHEGRRSIAA